MADDQYVPGYVSPGVFTNGWEVQVADMATLGQVSGLAEDRAFSEILRPTQFDGTNVYKSLLVYGGTRPKPGTQVTPAVSTATVAPGGAANGSVFVAPFRMFVGSQVALATDAKAWWRDIRSGLFIASPTNPYALIPLAANSSGNPRWDLVYAKLQVDAPTNVVTRRVKDPTAGSVSIQSKAVTLTQSVVVSVVQGTPGATPALPALPADGGGIYNLALAYVRVPNGFTSTSIVGVHDIRDWANGTAFQNVASLYHQSTGVATNHPADGNNDGAATYATNFPWLNTANTRPGPFMAPSWVGATWRMIGLDLANNGSPSHPNNSVVDQSIDWRNRVFLTFATASGSNRFAWDQQASGVGPGVPSVLAAGVTGPMDVQMGHSMYADASIVANGGSVYSGTNGSVGIGAASTVGLYVDMTTGQMKVHWTGTPAARMFLWVQASGEYPNT